MDTNNEITAESERDIFAHESAAEEEKKEDDCSAVLDQASKTPVGDLSENLTAMNLESEEGEDTGNHGHSGTDYYSSPASGDTLVSPSSSLSAISNNPGEQMLETKNRGGGTACLKITVHFLLLIAFVPLVASYCMRSIHDEVWAPLVTRATRTDEDLMEEFTYYHRSCSVPDLTASKDDVDALILQNGTAVEQVMTHGAAMLPKVLSPRIVRRLREFVVWKNKVTSGTEAEFPVSQGHRRISYGIEATEHAAVVDALKEIHDNPSVKATLEDLLGKNPAATEITAITSYYGAEDQVWHPDVKPDGNGLMWARTYSHSYSLFITLQDTTGEMGATDLCPGTHYCVDEDLYALCQDRKIGLHEVNGDHWTAGDGFLLNQQVWHRGTSHRDPHALERIVFIVSFLGRPTDPRQLSRGTYFHMKWNMWGHTFQDLGDAFISMSRPFNILRCLHIWKPKTRQWGYDLITSAALRIANGQLEEDEIYRFKNVLSRLGLPEFLHGQIDPEIQHWQSYIDETISKISDFLIQINIRVLVGYFVLALLASIRWQIRHKAGGARVLYNSFLRVLCTHGIVIILAIWLLEAIRSTEWARGISSGKTLMRPFPSQDVAWMDDPSVSVGPSTLPNRQDVLVGSRFDSKSMGAYTRWLNYHPGNRDFRRHVSKYEGQLYRSYEQGLPVVFHQLILDRILAQVEENDGRFLHQDYRSGYWRWMNRLEAEEYVRLMLVTGTRGLTAEIKNELDFLMADYRFGVLRGTVLSRLSQSYLRRLTSVIFGDLPSISKASDKTLTLSTPRRFVPVLKRHESMLTPVALDAERWSLIPTVSATGLRLGSMVVFKTRHETFHGTVVGQHNDKYEVAFYQDFAGRAQLVMPVHPAYLEPDRRVVQGARVHGNYRDYGEWFTGTILMVHPNALIDIRYDDGDLEEHVDPQHYVVI